MPKLLDQKDTMIYKMTTQPRRYDNQSSKFDRSNRYNDKQNNYGFNDKM